MCLAHRVSWEIHFGPESIEGMQVLHHCDTPACVRPSHLFLGTEADNARDKVEKGRQAEGLEHRQKAIHKRTAKRKSRFLGVSWVKSRNKWRAQAFLRGRNVSLGYFDEERAAANAYNAAVKVA